MKALGIESHVICGSLLLKESPSQASYQAALPHVFLQINGKIIDNTYVHIDESADEQENLHNFFESLSKIRRPDAYNCSLPSETNLVLLGDPSENSFMELACGTTKLNSHKYLSAMMAEINCAFGTIIYDKLMRHFIETAFGVKVEPITDKMSRICWTCGLSPEHQNELKSCTKLVNKTNKCGAKYCGKDCQRKDWSPMHKKLHIFIAKGFDCYLNSHFEP